MPFELAHALSEKYLFAQPSDLRLNPPEHYLRIQDFLILIYGVLLVIHCICVVSWKYKDSSHAKLDEYFTAMAYDLFLVSSLSLLLCICFLGGWVQVTAYWIWLAAQFLVGWRLLYLLLRQRDNKAHSLEMWISKCLAYCTANAIFVWRCVNVPQNWSYVGLTWSTWIIMLTLLAETVYPVVYFFQSSHNGYEEETEKSE